MKLLTKAQRDKLAWNGRERDDLDPKPVCKWFNPTGVGTWLVFWTDPEDPDRAFVLADLGSPELGWVRISELEKITFPVVLGIERDKWFEPDDTMTGYAEKARVAGRIEA